jgi:hypothetical protein
MRDANRRNALKSTGPTSAEGKARSSQNAVTHGLSARATVVLDESVEEFDAFAQAIRDDIRPAGPMEDVLVDRIVHLSWKLRRIPKVEAELLVDPDPSVMVDLDQADRIAHVMTRDLREQDSTMRKIQEYELRMDRSLQATLRELKRLRAMNREAAESQPVEEPGAQPVEPAHVANPQNEPVLIGPVLSNPLNPPARNDRAPTVAALPRARAS